MHQNASYACNQDSAILPWDELPICSRERLTLTEMLMPYYGLK